MKTSTKSTQKALTTWSLETLIKLGIHIGAGHKLNPQAYGYLYGLRKTADTMPIIDLERSISSWRSAIQYIQSVVQQEGEILFIGVPYDDTLCLHIKTLGHHYIEEGQYIEGTLSKLKWAIQVINNIHKHRDNPKAHLLSFRKKISRSLKGLLGMTCLPDAVVLCSTDRQTSKIIAEANKLAVPVIGFVDLVYISNRLTYPIIVNTQRPEFREFYLKTMLAGIGDIKDKNVYLNVFDRNNY